MYTQTKSGVETYKPVPFSERKFSAMPIITVQFIEDVVATPEQKRELIVRLTDTFCDILGDVVRPFVYCLIQETPQGEWGIAGVPMPDLVYLTGDKHAQVIGRSNDLMRAAIAQMQSSSSNNGSSNSKAEEHRKLFARWFEELWNKKNYDVAYELVDPDFTAHGAGGQDIKQGPDGVIGMVKAWHAAMPDGRMIVDDIITEGDLSTIRMTWEATHTGKFGDIPASGKRISVTSIGIDRVINGKITEGWGELNMLGMLQQMGAIPSPDAGPESADNGRTHKSEGAQVERNRVVIQRFHKAINEKDTKTLFELVHPNFVNHLGAMGDQTGPQALIDGLHAYYEGLPDLTVTEEFVVAQRSRVATRVTTSGTHKGTYMGAPASGKTVSWTGLVIYSLDAEGKIIERWQDVDAVGMMQQLGLIPAMG
jgi:steroid delta-isomerase-like uncharacterized protein/4-oxalocrotonate tautomerase family enzyme